MLLEALRTYVNEIRPVPPLSLEELRDHTQAVMVQMGLEEKYSDYAAVLLNNEVWRETVAAIPYSKRLLLIPKCLRHASECPAEFDEIGLLCKHCGRCVIDELKTQAEELGYAVLVAEGSPVVMSLIETGKIEAVVGISCLAVLERVFPYMEAGAVPGIAIPVLRDGCANTFTDLDWVWEAIYQTTTDLSRRLNLEALKDRVSTWLSRGSLEAVFAQSGTETERVAIEWMAKAGKRWRPFLTACVFEALSDEQTDVSEDTLRKAAVAVECFHKASLIHDDIEDGDSKRYGQQTLHEEYGVPVALNIGDLLLGEGYRLLIELDVAADVKTKLLDAAVQGHRTLCLGQGSELAWARNPGPLKVEEVLHIFRQKTSPAFEVALSLGAILAGADGQITGVLSNYSDALGTAYQIHDDLEDLRSPEKEHLLKGRYPSIILAMAYEAGSQHDKALLEQVWSGPGSEIDTGDVERIIISLDIEAAAYRMMESHKSRAIGSLIPLKNSELKSLLRRVLGKIFNDFEVMGCCNDPKAGHAKGREQGQGSSE
jgi:geranylgeranyl pyrophosphate synthase